MKTFRAAVAGGGFTLTGQLRLYQDTGRDDVVRQAECLAPFPRGHVGRPRLGSMAMGYLPMVACGAAAEP